MIEQKTSTLTVRRIEVDRLFGHTSYNLPESTDLGSKTTDKFFILYGDNGSGKTTILNMMFYLLTSEKIPGAKSYIAKIAFKMFSIYLSNGATISAFRSGEKLIGSYTIKVDRPNLPIIEIFLEADDSGSVKTSVDLILEVISSFNLSVFFLPDDRRILDARAHRREIEVGAISYYVEERITGQRVRQTPEGERSHHLDVEPILARVLSWIRRQALRGSSRGEKDTATIYKEIIDRIAAPHKFDLNSSPSSFEDLQSRIKELGKITEEYSKYGLIQKFPATEFLNILKNSAHESRKSIVTVLHPYTEGVEARVRALSHVHDVMSRFMEVAEPLLAPKKIKFTLSSGIRVFDKRGNPIGANLLSSGERQLILLFCYSLLTKNTPTILIIDEPELSLNVKWQRSLLSALAKISGDAMVQFILATHSLELLARHRSSTIRLIDVFEDTESLIHNNVSEEDTDNAESI
jgi:energy-coupling factor transporter ATP-binding protein EcfA2